MTAGQLGLILLASAIGATVKSVTGLGYPLIAVPIVSLALGVEDAVVIVERSARDEPLAWPDGVAPVMNRRYGEGQLWYGRPR